jgi:hypothetical protein
VRKGAVIRPLVRLAGIAGKNLTAASSSKHRSTVQAAGSAVLSAAALTERKSKVADAICQLITAMNTLNVMAHLSVQGRAAALLAVMRVFARAVPDALPARQVRLVVRLKSQMKIPRTSSRKLIPCFRITTVFLPMTV